jgi:hypothetical protein
VNNDHPDFAIPEMLDGEQRAYLPDFLIRACVDAIEDPLTVVAEVSGARRPAAGRFRSSFVKGG